LRAGTHTALRAPANPAKPILLAAVLSALLAAAVEARLAGPPVLPAWVPGVVTWWPEAGVIVAAMLRGPRRWWPALLAITAVTTVAGEVLIGASMLRTASLTASNLTEVLLAGTVLTGWRRPRTFNISTRRGV
jgi:uncharacterized membrane protein YhaH (DUF805 family)